MSTIRTKLTLAIPVYNDARYIEATVLSAAAQGAEVVVYDNASTDGTSDIVAALAARLENVSHIRHPQNIGAFANFKAALDQSKTPYFSWIGSHDLLSPDYAARIIETIEKESDAILAAGTIEGIDEDGQPTGEVTKTKWATTSKGRPPLYRAGACATGLRRDCSIFYGVWRTQKLREVWFDQPCLGFDRILLVRAAAAGEIIYVPDPVFYARNLDKSRDAKTDRDRRVAVVGEKPIEKNVFLRNFMMAKTILDLATTPEELGAAFDFIDVINRRYQNRRRYQRQRLVKIGLGFIITIAFVAALLT